MSALCNVRRYKKGEWERIDDRVSREEALYVTWSGPDAAALFPSTSAEESRRRVRLWAWPGPDRQALRELALGHVLLECVPEEQTHRLRGTVTDTADGFHVTLSAVDSASLCATFDPARAAMSLQDAASEPDQILARMDGFMGLHGQWDGTGCFHRAGIWLPNPHHAVAELHVAEDIGRHNCLDRLMGYAVAHGFSLRGQVLFVTARVTASLYTKARRMGFGGVVSRSAVSLYAVEAARRDGVRLMGFCRPREARVTFYA